MSDLNTTRQKVVAALQQEYGLSAEDAHDAANAGAYFRSVDPIGRRAESIWKAMKVAVPMTTQLHTDAYKSGARWAVAHQSAS